MTPPRLRRKRRLFLPYGENKHAAYLAELSHQATPSFDFFLFSLLAGLALAIAILLDSPAIYFLAILISPMMAPMIGIPLGIIVGLPRYFFQSLIALLIGSLLIFFDGALVGIITNFFPDLSFQQITSHIYFSWADLAVLGAGAILTPLLLAHSPKTKPFIGSAALAYAIYIPIGIAGFGVTRGMPIIWQNGLAVFLLNIGVAVFITTIILIFLGIRSTKKTGFVLGLVLVIICLGGAGFLGGFFPGFSLPQISQISFLDVSSTPIIISTETMLPSSTFTVDPTPSGTPTSQPSATFIPPTSTPTQTYTPTQATPTPSSTPTNTEIALPTMTPIWAIVDANEGNGVLFRTKPSFLADPVAEPNNTLLNGSKVMLFETIKNEDAIWIHVRLQTKKGDIDGWILRSLLATITPTPIR